MLACTRLSTLWRYHPGGPAQSWAGRIWAGQQSYAGLACMVGASVIHSVRNCLCKTATGGGGSGKCIAQPARIQLGALVVPQSWKLLFSRLFESIFRANIFPPPSLICSGASAVGQAHLGWGSHLAVPNSTHTLAFGWWPICNWHPSLRRATSFHSSIAGVSRALNGPHLELLNI